MNPRSLAIIFTIIIFLVAAYAGWVSFEQKFGLDKEKAQAYFFKGEDLAAIKKDLLNEQNAIKESFALLLKGPDPKKTRQGFYTILPEGLQIYGYSQEGDMLTIRINQGFKDFSGGTSQIRAAVAQLVYTATAQKGIRKVLIKVSGAEGPLIIGGEGYTIEKPLSRRDIEL